VDTGFPQKMRPAKEATARRARPLLGTFVEITVAGAAPANMHAAIEAAFDAVAKVHALMSFHDAGSDVGRLNSEPWSRPVAVHSWTFQVLEAAVDLYGRSAGAFDIAVAQILQELGRLPRGQTDGWPVFGKPAKAEAIELLSGGRVRFARPEVRIDLGGIAKGFAVDRAIDVLRDHGMPRGLVNAGGDLAAFGPHAETVHIRNPRDPSRLMLGLAIENQALASSGHRFDPLRSANTSGTATIDPRTGKPVQAIIAATVRAPTCMIADALTKVVMVEAASAGPLLEHYTAGALMVLADGGVQMTEDLSGAVRLAA
jgi:thiamine biosynthesis lipoprotein